MPGALIIVLPASQVAAGIAYAMLQLASLTAITESIVIPTVLDLSVPLTAFVFLVALGVDRNIFLMSRMHEEARRIGTRPATVLGLAATGGVITSAGPVLAATFSVLTILPFVSMVEVGLLVGIGVLLDTFIVRSVLVPALCLDIGGRIWRPGGLSRRPAVAPGGVTGEAIAD